MIFEPVFRYLRDVDLGGMFLLVLALIYIGNRVSAGQFRLRGLCLSMSAILFVAFAVVHLTYHSAYFDSLSDLTFRGLLASGFILGISWIVLPPLAALYRSASDWTRNWLHQARYRREERRRARELEVDRRRREQLEPEAARERERLRCQAEEQARRRAAEQKRREEARARCDVLFALHGPDLRERFTKEMYEDFVARHLGDSRTPEYVEQRAKELCDLLQKHLEMAHGKKRNLAELAAWFLEEKKQIDQTALSEDDKELLISQLEERYVKLQEKYLRSVQP